MGYALMALLQGFLRLMEARPTLQKRVFLLLSFGLAELYGGTVGLASFRSYIAHGHGSEMGEAH